MKELLDQYKRKAPEIIFEWHDEATGAEGWLVINSLRNGAAGGGTRMRKGLTREEVISLSKVMEIKFSVCGPPIGGAKSGINFDPNDPRKDEVLSKWFKAVLPLLKNYYGTGGDLNIDIKEVTRHSGTHGLLHTQEGVLTGHFKLSPSEKTKRLEQLKKGVYLPVKDASLTPSPDGRYSVADLITGWGVAESVRHYYDIFLKTGVKDKKLIVQGWGNVAAPAAFYLSNHGAKLTGIMDKSGGILNEDGFSLEEVRRLILTRKGTRLSTPGMMSFYDINQSIWNSGAEIFIPAAASKLINRQQIETLVKQGLEVISCGANVPFEDDGIFHGPTSDWVDQKIGLIPDFIANCGMARTFAYLMNENPDITDKSIFHDTSEVIRKAMQEVYEKNPEAANIAHDALEVALTKRISGS